MPNLEAPGPHGLRPSSGGPVSRIGIVADDLTGAADALVKFRNHGWASRLFITPDFARASETGPGAVSCSTGSRSIGDEQAARLTAQAVSGGIRTGLDRIYLKIDSTMRGSVSGQIRGALDAWTQRAPSAFSVICPAYPQAGRVVCDGKVLVDGIPLHLSPAGHDPVDPVADSGLTALVPGARVIRATSVPGELIDVLHRVGVPGARIVVEAQCEAHMHAIAQAVDFFGPDVVAAGSGGLAGCLADVWRGQGRVLTPAQGVTSAQGRVIVAVTSLNGASLAQADRLLHDWPTLADRFFLDPAMPEGPLVPSGGRRQRPGGGSARVCLLQPRPGAARVAGAASRVAHGIASAVRALVLDEASDVSGLVLVGGDGAQAVLAALGAEAFLLEGNLAEGVPWGRLLGGIAAGKTIVTKAGGFGDQGVLSGIVSTLLGVDGKYQ